MSEVTLDEDLITSGFMSISSFDEVVHPLQRPARFANPQSVDSLLWGFDEDAESVRFSHVQRRLIKLEAALFEEYGVRLNSFSKDCLLQLFVSYPTVSAPLISAQPDGVLMATWRLGPNEELVIKCVSRTKLHYSTISASAQDPSRIDRQWGTFHNAALFFSENPLARRIAG